MLIERNEAGYRWAVDRMLSMGESVTSGGRAAAQVLLSTYNGHHYHMDATDLCLLGGDDLEAAITVLAQRSLTSKEPHTLDSTFPERFDKIEDLWHFLHVKERYPSVV